MEYRLNVIKRINGKYKISNVQNLEDEILSDFPALISKILFYSREDPGLFVEEPILLGLGEEEEKVIRGIRGLVLEKRYS